jgi:LysM repeat protein
MKKKYIIIVFLVLVVVFAGLYFSQIGKEDYENSSPEETELMDMNASLNTLVPMDRARRSVEEYEIQEGDSINTVAQYYGLNKQSILKLNNITEEDTLEVGQIVKIPPVDGIIITVKEGDTLESLAKEYGAESQDIADFNWLDYPFSLEIGSTIFIPLEF